MPFPALGLACDMRSGIYLVSVRGTERSRSPDEVILASWRQALNECAGCIPPLAFPLPRAGIHQQESKNMNVVHDYRRVMVSSAGWLGPLSSPVLALGATKVVALLWTFLLHS